MKAAFIEKYGSADELQVGEIPMPLLGDQDVMVKIHASSVNPVDWKFRNGELKIVTGFKFPIYLGKDFAGEVVAIGSQVKQVKIGDRVWGQMGGTSGGAYAEFASVPQGSLGIMPSNLSFEEAASIPLVGLTALQSLRHKKTVEKGTSVLINGASGGVGTMGVQLAHALGANVTAICSSKNVDFVKNLGADQVIDYQKADFSQGKNKYDLILDFVGNYSFLKCAPILKPEGIYLTITPQLASMVSGFIAAFFSSKQQQVIFAKPNVKDLNFLKYLVENGQLKPIIDRHFPISEIAAAHRYSEKGHSRGKIVIKIVS
jgi:2-desacetyl-2-hydroxyethyl bacteriochlorophyllide A dehydrogenase